MSAAEDDMEILDRTSLKEFTLNVSDCKKMTEERMPGSTPRAQGRKRVFGSGKDLISACFVFFMCIIAVHLGQFIQFQRRRPYYCYID